MNYSVNLNNNLMMIEQTQSENSKSDISGSPLVYKIKEYRPKSVKETLSYMLIRPPRFLYNQSLLIPPQRYQEVFQYEQFNIPFKLSLYKVKKMKYVVLYLHGNSSSRFEGYMHLKELPPGVGLACFDFNGCGMRFQSSYITLGKNQSKEVDQAAKFLKEKGYRVVGWGRSMGSVSLLLSQQCDIMVADSPFCSLNQLCKSSSQQFLPSICCCFFHCLYPCVFCCVRSDVLQKSGMDPDQLQICSAIQNNLKNKKRKLFVMAGKEDTMIPFSHAERIHNCFPGTKHLCLFEGTHNSNRPLSIIRKCFIFIQTQLGLDPHPCLYEKENKFKSKIKLKSINHSPATIKIGQSKQTKQLTQSEQVRSPEVHKMEEKSLSQSLNLSKSFSRSKGIDSSFKQKSMSTTSLKKQQEMKGEKQNDHHTLRLLEKGILYDKKKDKQLAEENKTFVADSQLTIQKKIRKTEEVSKVQDQSIMEQKEHSEMFLANK